ncbi:MAG TPA: HAD family hydrolase [Polyangiaceae bacterium]|nr:HAD family hydrolase [Polyangiaceae bacterium]
MTAPKVALLDIDGTLLDSNDAHALAWLDVFAEFGHKATFEQVRELIGKGGDKLVPEVTGLAKDSPEGEALAKRRSAIFAANYLPDLRPFPGARALLEALQARGLALVVATSSGSDQVDGLLRAAGVRDLIDEQTTADDAARSKPDPDVVRAALAKSGRRPAEAVMLGDTPYDVEAATRAGVAAVALRCGGWGDGALRGAAAVYDGPADLLANYEGSPFARRVV